MMTCHLFLKENVLDPQPVITHIFSISFATQRVPKIRKTANGRLFNLVPRSPTANRVRSGYEITGYSQDDEYRKIPKISPSKYKPPKPVTQKNPPLSAPPNISPPGACTWKVTLKYNVKQRKNGKFTSNYKVSPIEFETQISHRR